MNTTRDKIEEIQAQNSQRYRFFAIVLIMAAIVVAGVALWLHLTGVAATGDALCGKEEHTHTKDCYEQVLICENEEEGHEHDSSCYENELVCMIDEHVHTASCYASTSETDSSDSKASSSQVSAGAKSGSEADDDGQDVAANVSSSALKEINGYISSVSLKGDWGRDVAAVASSLEGYTAPEDVYEIASQVTKQGFESYDSWNEAFAAFCLAYAKVSDKYVPRASNVREWISDLQKGGMYEPAQEFVPSVGDLVFYDSVGDSKADSVAVVTAVNSDLGQMKVVQGKSDGSTVKVSYDYPEASSLFGYCPVSSVQDRLDDPDAAEDPSANDDDKSDASDVIAPIGPDDEGQSTVGDFSTFIKDQEMTYQVLENGEWLDVDSFADGISKSSKMRLVAPYAINLNMISSDALKYSWKPFGDDATITAVDEASGILGEEWAEDSGKPLANYTISKTGAFDVEFSKDRIDTFASSPDEALLFYEGDINITFDASAIKVSSDGSAILPLGEDGKHIYIIEDGSAKSAGQSAMPVAIADDDQSVSPIYTSGDSATINVSANWVNENGDKVDAKNAPAVDFKLERIEYPINMGIIKGGSTLSEVNLSIDVDLVKGAADSKCALPQNLSSVSLVKPGTSVQMAATVEKSADIPSISANGTVLKVASKSENGDEITYRFQPVVVNGNTVINGYIFDSYEKAASTDAANVLSESFVELSNVASTDTDMTGSVAALSTLDQKQYSGQDLVLDSANGYQMTLANLPASGAYSKDATTTVYYQYGIKEATSSEYTLMGTSIEESDGAINVVLNLRENAASAYQLPKTGELGARTYVMFGMLVIALPFALYACAKRGRRRFQ